jgi:hypothetical protein
MGWWGLEIDLFNVSAIYIPEEAFYLHLGVHLSEEIHVGTHLQGMFLVGAGELIVHDRERISVDHDTIWPMSDLPRTVLACTYDVTFVDDGVVASEPFLDTLVREALLKAV